MCTRVHVCMCVCVRVCACVYMCVCTSMWCAHECVCLSACVHMCACASACAFSNTSHSSKHVPTSLWESLPERAQPSSQLPGWVLPAGAESLRLEACASSRGAGRVSDTGAVVQVPGRSRESSSLQQGCLFVASAQLQLACSFTRAVVTKDHKLRGLNIKCMISQLWRLEIRDQGVGGIGSGGKSFPGISPSFW